MNNHEYLISLYERTEDISNEENQITINTNNKNKIT